MSETNINDPKIRSEVLRIKREITGVVDARLAQQQEPSADDLRKKEEARQAQQEEKQKLADARAELYRHKREENYTRALDALQSGPINLVRTAKGISEHFEKIRGKSEYARVDFGYIGNDPLTQRYFVDISTDFGASPGNPDFKTSRKVRVMYDPAIKDPQEAYKILLSDPQARKTNRQLNEGNKLHTTLAYRENNPESDLRIFGSTNGVEIFDDILNANQQARLTFDYRDERGRPDYLVESRQLVWDNEVDILQLEHNGK